ncbi:MAG: hypothetical protein Q9219_002359 [cf. Caloplaca sp. 3 TL-2023]
MPTPNKGRSTVVSHSHSAPDLPPLGSLSITRARTPEEGTPRASRGAQASSTDDDYEDYDELEDGDFNSHESLDGLSGSDSSDYDSESNSGSDPGNVPNDTINRQRPYLHHSSSSLLSAYSFAPPFYNKPPTPLPPSPSLTSLLRPSFSATTSRPTTPNSSEDDTPNDTEAAVAKSARTATTVARANPKVPTYEYYGFVLYLMSTLVFPLAAYNTEYLTLPMKSIENIVDEAANVAAIDHYKRARNTPIDRPSASQQDWAALWDEGTDAVMDVPVGGVCQILYGSS